MNYILIGCPWPLGPHKYCVVYWINIYAVDSIIHWFKQLQVPWSPVHLKEMRFIEERDHVHVDHKEFLFFCKIHIFWSFYWLYNVLKPAGISVVFQFYPWFKFYFPLFWGMRMSLKQREIKFKPRINLNYNISITFFQLVFFLNIRLHVYAKIGVETAHPMH